MWVAEADGRIAGFRTFLRWEFATAGTILRTVRAVDTATDPDFQGRGIFTTLTLAAIEELRADGVDFVFNTPNDQSRPGYLKMGWRVVGRLPIALRPTGPAGLLRIARARTPAARGAVPTTAGTPATTVLADRGLAEALLAHTPAGDGLTTHRTPEYLRWRYGLETLHYRVTGGPAGLGAGAVVFHLRRRGPAIEAVICETLVPPGDRRTRRARVHPDRPGDRGRLPHSAPRSGGTGTRGMVLARAGHRADPHQPEARQPFHRARWPPGTWGWATSSCSSCGVARSEDGQPEALGGRAVTLGARSSTDPGFSRWTSSRTCASFAGTGRSSLRRCWSARWSARARPSSRIAPTRAARPPAASTRRPTRSSSTPPASAVRRARPTPTWTRSPCSSRPATCPRQVAEELGGDAADWSSRISTVTNGTTSTLDITCAERTGADARACADTFAKALLVNLHEREQTRFDGLLNDTVQRQQALQQQIADLDAQIAARPPDVDLLQAQRNSLVNQYRLAYERFQGLADQGGPGEVLSTLESGEARPITAAEYASRIEQGRLGQNRIRGELGQSGEPVVSDPGLRDRRGSRAPWPAASSVRCSG